NQYISFTVDGAVRMRQILRDLLEFSRVGRPTEELQQVDLQEIINEVLAVYKIKIKDKKAKITTSNLPVVSGFTSDFFMVFQNLIDNAIKYAQEGVPPKIEVDFTEDNHHFIFTVKDNGIGIEEEYFERIFVIFQ